MPLGQPSGWIQVVLGLGSGFILAGITLFVTGGWRSTQGWILLTVGVIIAAFGLLSHFNLWQTQTPVAVILTMGLTTGAIGAGLSALLITRANARVDVETHLFDLLNKGDAALHSLYDGVLANSPEAVSKGQGAVESWRAEAGTYFNTQPSLVRRRARERVLSSGGDRITEPLIRLRNMIDNLDQWLD